jgi:hypothetical protein
MKILFWNIVTDKGLEKIKAQVRKERREFTNKQISDLCYQNAMLKGQLMNLRGH